MARLLLLEDEEDSLAWMRSALESRGHEVRGFLEGRAALDALSTFKPDLIVSDILMPEMDGLTFARLARKIPGIPVIFVSISKFEADAVVAGAVGYVKKPATADELRSAVERVLGEGARKNTLLVVEDDPDISTVYRTYLEPTFDVLTAENGRVALDVLKTRRIDLAIVDVHMPVMNGAELVRAMRADPALAAIPVVIQTSDRAALSAPLWGQLHVARVMEKETFVDWCEGKTL